MVGRISLNFLLLIALTTSGAEPALSQSGSQATDTLAIEIGANDFRISDMGPDGDNSYGGNSPAVAYNSTDNEFLVVWRGSDNTGALVVGEFEIFGRRIDAETGAQIGADFRISDMGMTDGNNAFDAAEPAVAYNSTNNEYLVVWSGDDDSGALINDEFEIYGQRVDAASGAEIGVDFRISDMGAADGNTNFNAIEPDLAYNSTDNEYLVVWQGDDDTAPLVDNEVEIFGQRIDAETGAELGGDFRISNQGPDGDTMYIATIPAVAFNSTDQQYLVVWSGDDNSGALINNEFEIYGQRIEALTGALIGGDFRISQVGPADGAAFFNGGNPDVAYNSNDNEFLVIWRADDGSGSMVEGEFEVFGQRLNGATGAELGSDFRISDMGPDGVTAFEAREIPQVEYNSIDNQYLVVWWGDDEAPTIDNEFEIYGQIIEGGSGSEIGGDFRISDAGPDVSVSFSTFDPALAYNNTNNRFLIVWSGDDDAVATLANNEFEIWGQLLAAVADLALTLSDSSDPVTAGMSLTYTVGLNNAGPDQAHNVTVTDTLPAEVTFESASGTGWNCGESSGIVTCSRSSLALGAAPDISIVVSTDPDGSGSISNLAMVTSASFDGNSVDDSASESTTISPTACQLKASNKKCRKKKFRRPRKCRFETTITTTDSGSAVSGAEYSLQKKSKKNGFSAVKTGTTDSSGTDTLKVRVRKTSTFRSFWSTGNCTSNQVKIRVKRKKN